MDRSRIAIVIPALNESATIALVVEAAGRYGVPIVVDDGSDDDTAELAVQAGAVVVSHPQNYGYDVALDSGFKKAAELGSEIIVTVDADGQHDPSLIRKFIDAIVAGADVVIGIRSRRQRFAEHLFAWYTRFRFGISDPLCGMKAYRETVYHALGHFDSFGSIGTELMIFAAKSGFKCEQLHFRVQERAGKSRFGSIISSNMKIFRAMLLSVRCIKGAAQRSVKIHGIIK
ncbi:MAG: glycosyltransferase family 2 protein [Pseudomonadales bacterium]|nr:glycosyltransferase family 2 protein [Pseudomonadales bacterium]